MVRAPVARHAAPVDTLLRERAIEIARTRRVLHADAVVAVREIWAVFVVDAGADGATHAVVATLTREAVAVVGAQGLGRAGAFATHAAARAIRVVVTDFVHGRADPLDASCPGCTVGVDGTHVEASVGRGDDAGTATGRAEGERCERDEE